MALPEISGDGSKIAFISDVDFLNESNIPFQGEIWLHDTESKTLTRVTHGGSDRSSSSPSISQDGSKLVFQSDADFLSQSIPTWQTEIWLYDTTNAALSRLTMGSSDRTSSNPSISSDGSKIAFYSNIDFLGESLPQWQKEIWLYDTATMTVTRVTHGGVAASSLSINADGSKIAFSSATDLLNESRPYAEEIWLYDTSTMTLTRVTTSTGRASTSPSINGDGTKIAFRSNVDFLGQSIPQWQQEIWLYDTATMTVTRATNGGTSSDLRMSHDGSKIAFLSAANYLGLSIPDNYQNIWLYETAAMTLTHVLGAPQSDLRFLSINDDASQLAFISDFDFLSEGLQDRQFEIWVANHLAQKTYLPIVIKP